MIFQLLLQEKWFHLQDPIEVSALRMVMQETNSNLWKRWDRTPILWVLNNISCISSLISWQERPSPIMNTSAKTNLGHLEASAGMAGCAIAPDFEVLWILVGFFCGIPRYLHDS